MNPQRIQLPDGRWHFQHGPIDIIIGAYGRPAAVEAAHAKAWDRFTGILGELVEELPFLRRPVMGECHLHGPIARRMWNACHPYRRSFITPMAAVAGAVAQELVACYAKSGIDRAWVNNGGDIALHLAPTQSVRIGLYADLARLDVNEISAGVHTDGQFEVSSALPVRGVATSGWRGRSFSLGIADSVTVLAHTAAQADAAATMIANAVDVADVRIKRSRACDLKDDTDLGEMLVTIDVPLLEEETVRRALRSGLERAHTFQAEGLIWSAALVCQNQLMTTSDKTSQPLKNHGAETQVGSVFA
jgi:ApbE superfamily uncharacterized protein (UPF0280 family)